MEIKVYKTYEITEELWQKIADGFIESFERNVSPDRLRNSFCTHNPLGYGYHAVAMAENGEVAGYNVFSPTFYKGNIKVVVSGSTYVRPQYRNESMFIFLNMMRSLRKVVISDGFNVEVGVPNNNSRDFAAKMLKLKYVGDLNYYILPCKISKCLNKPFLRFVDSFVPCILYFHLWVQKLWSSLFNTKEKEVKYEIESSEEYLKARFKGNYKHIKKGDIESYYCLYDEDGKNTAYLMDFREKGKRSSRSLNYAVRTIQSNEHPDAILFVGLLRLKQFSLFKVPKKFEPKPLSLTYYVLNNEDTERFSDMDDMSNWNFSLMNFDVR